MDLEKDLQGDKNILSMILGIVSIVLSLSVFFSFFGLIIGVVGLIIAIKYKYVIGMILNAIGIIIITVIISIFIFICAIGAMLVGVFSADYYNVYRDKDTDYTSVDYNLDLLACDYDGVYVVGIEEESLNYGQDEYLIIEYGLDYDNYISQEIKLENLILIVNDKDGNINEISPIKEPLLALLNLPELSDNESSYYIGYKMIYSISQGDSIKSIKYKDGDYEFECFISNVNV